MPKERRHLPIVTPDPLHVPKILRMSAHPIPIALQDMTAAQFDHLKAVNERLHQQVSTQNLQITKLRAYSRELEADVDKLRQQVLKLRSQLADVNSKELARPLKRPRRS